MKAVRTRITHRRRRYRPAGIDRYLLEGQMESLYDKCKTVEDLRNRFRDFAADNQIWSIIQKLHDEVAQRNKTLDALAKRCREIGGRNGRTSNV